MFVVIKSFLFYCQQVVLRRLKKHAGIHKSVCLTFTELWVGVESRIKRVGVFQDNTELVKINKSTNQCT